MTTDNTDIRALLGLTFEIEGLLMLTERRAEMTPAEVSQMLIDKCARLMDGVASLTASADSAPSSIPADEAVVTAVPTPEQQPVEEEIRIEENDGIADAAAYEEVADADIEPQPEEEIASETVEEVPVPTPVQAPAVPSAPEQPVAPAKPAKTITLTLNDRFRFRRTLFGGSDAMMNETVTALSAITNPDDIADFITNDLCWSIDDPEVADFLAIVEAAR